MNNSITWSPQVEGSWLQGDPRTLESLATNQENYQREGQGDRARLMNFYNSEFQVFFIMFQIHIYPYNSISLKLQKCKFVIRCFLFQPLLHPHPSATSPTKILHKMPPPPLHCVRLGSTNHLLTCLQHLWPDLQVLNVQCLVNYITMYTGAPGKTAPGA